MSKNVGEVNIKVELDKASLSSSLNSAKGDVDRWAEDVESRTSKLGSAIKAGLLAAGVATAGLAKSGLSSYKDLQEASSQAASKAIEVHGKSAEEIQESYDDILKHVMDVSADVGATTVFTALQVAETYDALAAGGIDIANVGRKELIPFMNVAAATGEDLLSVTNLVTGSMAAFGYSMSETETIADQLSMAMNVSKADLSTLNYALRQGGSAASATGMELSEFSAIVGVLADRNYTGMQSGAALKTAMLSLYNPTQAQADVLEKLGITYAQVDPRVNSFIDTLKLLISKGADIGDFGKVFTDSSGAIMYALANSSDAVEGMKEAIAGSKGLSQIQADLIMDTRRLVGAWETAKSAADGLVTSFGEWLEPAAVRLLNTFTGLSGKIMEFAGLINEGRWVELGTRMAGGIRSGLATLADIGKRVYDYIINYDYVAAGGKIAGWIETGLDKLRDLRSTMLEWIEDQGGWEGVGIRVGHILAAGVRSGIGLLSDIGHMVYGYLTSVDWGDVGSRIATAIRGEIAFLSGLASTIYGYLVDYDYAAAGSWIASGIRTGITNLTALANIIYDYIINYDYVAAGSWIADRVRAGIEVLQDIGATIAGWIESHGGWEGVGRAVGEKISSGIAALATYAKGIEERLKNWIEADARPLGRSIGEKVAAGIGEVATYADGIKTDLQAWIGSGGPANLGYDIGRLIADAIKSVMDLGRWIADSLAEKGGGNLIRGAILTVVEWASLGATAVSQFVSGFVEGLAPIGAAIYNVVADAVANALDMVPYGAGEALAGTIRESKREVDWGRKTYDPITGSWTATPSTAYGYAGGPAGDLAKDTGAVRGTSGALVASWQDNELRISKGVGAGTMSAEEWAREAGRSGKFTEEDIRAELKKMYAAKVMTTPGHQDQIVAWFREGAQEAAQIETNASRSNTAIYSSATQKFTTDLAVVHGVWKANQAAINAEAVNTSNFVNTNLRGTSMILSSDLVGGSSAILEAGRVVKSDFELGTYNWVSGVNQSSNVQLSATNQSAAIALDATEQRSVLEINSATAASLYTTAAGQGLKTDVEASGSNFGEDVVAAGESFSASVRSSIGAAGGRQAGGLAGNVGTANFTDCLFEGGFVDGCTGVSIPGLKYTNPQGVTSIINPMDYISGGGISKYINLRARGGLITSPEVALIGERGSEMVLPHDITQTIVNLTNMGLGRSRMAGGGTTTVEIHLDGRKIAEAVMDRATGQMRQSGLMVR